MKIYFYSSVAASGLSLLLSIILFAVGSSNQGLQTELQKKQAEVQKQQEEINKAQTIVQKVGPSLLQDMANVATKDEAMKKLLSKHGYEIKVEATPAPGAASPKTGAASPAPGAAAPAAAAPAPAHSPTDAPALRPQ